METETLGTSQEEQAYEVEKSRKKCECELCKLTPLLTNLAKKATPEEKAAMETIFARMEAAELDLEVIKAKKEGTWPTNEKG